MWLAFGIIMYLENRKSNRVIYDKIVQFSNSDRMNLILFGFIGGGISSLFGTGINIFTFCFLVIYYKINEKVATPSSIVIMTIETIAGFILHALVLKDVSPLTYEMWLSCIPIVIFFAPLGAYVVHRISRIAFTNFLYFIFLVQSLGAIFVIRPDIQRAVISIAILLFGLVLFRYIGLLKRKTETH